MDDQDAYLANLAEIKQPKRTVGQVQPCIHHLRSGRFEWSVHVWRDEKATFAAFSIQGTRGFATEDEAIADMNATLVLLGLPVSE